MSKKYFDLSKSEDIDQIHQLLFSEEDDRNDNLEESGDSETEDNLETRSFDSETDHENDSVSEEEEPPQIQGYFLGM